MSDQGKIRRVVLVCIVGVLVVGAVSNARPVAPTARENAALVYYQAFIASERVRDRWHIEIDRIIGGQDLTEDMRKRVTQDIFRQPIELASAAMQIPLCDWGLLSSGPYSGDRLVAGNAQGLASLFSIDGRVLAFEGQYRPALERAGEMGRLASHIGDDTYVTWVTSVRVNASAFRLVQYVLGVMPPDVDTLVWLKGQFASGPRANWRPRETLSKWRDMEIRGWQAYPNDYASLLPTGAEESLTVESLRTAYDRYLESAVTILQGDGEYEAKCAQLKQLKDRVIERAKTDSDTTIMIRAMQWWEPYYRVHVLHRGVVDAVKAAVEIYLIKATTGRLPSSLPEDLPKDPFSGKDFEYLLTDTGFTLRCRVAPIDYWVAGERLKIRQYEFKLAE